MVQKAVQQREERNVPGSGALAPSDGSSRGGADRSGRGRRELAAARVGTDAGALVASRRDSSGGYGQRESQMVLSRQGGTSRRTSASGGLTQGLIRKGTENDDWVS